MFLPDAEHDHFFLAPGDRDAAAVVDAAEIAGVEPAVLDHVGGGIGTVVIALHDDRPTNHDLAVDDLDVHSWKRTTDGIDVRVAGRADCRGGAGFGEPVHLQDDEAKRVEVPADHRIELRAAGDEKPHVAAHHVVDLAEEDAPEVDADAAQPEIEREQRPEQDARHQVGLRNLLHHALVNQVEELRHAREDRDLPLRKRLDEIRRVQRLEVDDAGTRRKREQQVRELRERMEQRQHSKDRVPVGDVDCGEGGIAFRQQICMGQHHSLWVGRCAARVQDHCWRRRNKFQRFQWFQKFQWCRSVGFRVQVLERHRHFGRPTSGNLSLTKSSLAPESRTIVATCAGE